MNDLSITELSEVTTVLRTYISQAKHVNKKNRLKNALKKLEINLAFEERKITEKYVQNHVTFPKRNICSNCHQPIVQSTLASW